METKDLNRLKVVLAEKKRTNKWLAEQLGKDPATISKWCTNNAQPTLENLLDIARWRFEDCTVLRQEFLRLTPARICLAVAGKGLNIVIRQDAHIHQGGSQALPFLFRFRHQPGRTFHMCLGWPGFVFVHRPSALAPVALQFLQGRGQRLSAFHRQWYHLHSSSGWAVTSS